MNGKYCYGFQALSLCGHLYLSLLQFYLSTYLATMAARSGSKPSFVVTNYFASSSDEDKDKKEIEDLELPDFELFYASYR